MALFKQIYKIVEDVVSSIEWDIDVKSISESGGLFTLEVCNTAFLNQCKIFVDSMGDSWEVTDFVFNKSLTVKAYRHSNIFTDTNITLNIPKFLHGTIRLSSAEYDAESKKEGIHPLIYLYQVQNERPSLDVRDAIERTATIRVFLIMANNFKDFIRKDYDSQVFDPLSNIEEEFINKLKDNSNIPRLTERYTRINHEQFGTTDSNGYLKRIFNGELSALELSIPLNINNCTKENFNC